MIDGHGLKSDLAGRTQGHVHDPVQDLAQDPDLDRAHGESHGLRDRVQSLSLGRGRHPTVPFIEKQGQEHGQGHVTIETDILAVLQGCIQLLVFSI